VVVLGDNWFPGWKAEVDGKPVDIERVDYVLRGTVAGAGHHRVEYRYEPASWRIGWIVSLLSLLALAGAVAVSRRRSS
jgi:MYXO-CTERM domain-containing protein